MLRLQELGRGERGTPRHHSWCEDELRGGVVQSGGELEDITTVFSDKTETFSSTLLCVRENEWNGGADGRGEAAAL
jgi:hypothetical protein